jgi:hypothetical protein
MRPRGRIAGRVSTHTKRGSLGRLKCKKLISGEECVAERLVYSRFFDTQIGERNGNGVDGLLAALIEEKRLRQGESIITV